MPTIHISAISESALVCSLPAPACLPHQRLLWGFADNIQHWDARFEVVIGMNNVTIFTDQETDLNKLTEQLHHIWQQAQAADYQGKHIEIPVCYGGEYGEDLQEVANYHQVSIQEIIKRHTAPIYTVFMMGFQPGFSYLGGLPENLHTPRRAVPRTLVPAGSVGIGGSQTGMYPFASPGGWQIIGRTDIELFQANSTSPTLLTAGDTVQFVAKEIFQ